MALARGNENDADGSISLTALAAKAFRRFSGGHEFMAAIAPANCLRREPQMKSCLWAPLLALAATPYAYTQQIDNRSPDAVVKSTIDEVMSAIKSDPAARAGDPDAIDGVVEKKFLPHTDFLRATRLAVGSAWAKATPEQQKELFQQFQTLLAHTYATQLAQIRDQNVKFQFHPMAPLPAGATDAVVKTVVDNNGDIMNIDYRLNKTSSGWKIYDINMMGAWMIIIYRGQFAEQIARGGIDGLIKFLAAHNER